MASEFEVIAPPPEFLFDVPDVLFEEISKLEHKGEWLDIQTLDGKIREDRCAFQVSMSLNSTIQEILGGLLRLFR